MVDLNQVFNLRKQLNDLSDSHDDTGKIKKSLVTAIISLKIDFTSETIMRTVAIISFTVEQSLY